MSKGRYILKNARADSKQSIESSKGSQILLRMERDNTRLVEGAKVFEKITKLVWWK